MSADCVILVAGKSDGRNMTVDSTFELPLEAIREYCAGQPIRRLSLFGSALDGNMGADSDVDLLVEYKAGSQVGLAFFQHIVDLSEIIGREVDLRTPEDLSRFFRNAVCESARPIYESQQRE